MSDDKGYRTKTNFPSSLYHFWSEGSFPMVIMRQGLHTMAKAIHIIILQYAYLFSIDQYNV